MKLSRQRAIYVGLLGLGLAALSVDKLMLAPAGATAADPPAAAMEQPARPAADPTAVGAPAARGPALADRLERAAAAAASERDGFTASTAWVRPVDALAGERAGPTAAEQFQAAHKLTSIFTSRTSSGTVDIAIIGGRPYKVGSELAGFRLKLIDEQGRRVVFEAEAGEAVLSLPKPQVGTPEARPPAGSGQERGG